MRRKPCLTVETTIQCPHVLSDAEGNGGHPESGECQADVPVTLEWTPGEMWGQDADGNRGVWRSGYFSPIAWGPCPKGCVWDAIDEANAETLAARAAEDYEGDQ